MSTKSILTSSSKPWTLKGELWGVEKGEERKTSSKSGPDKYRSVYCSRDIEMILKKCILETLKFSTSADSSTGKYVTYQQSHVANANSHSYRPFPC